MMVSRAYIYYGRPKSSSNKVAEFRLLRKQRQHQHSTNEMHQRTEDRSRLFKLSNLNVGSQNRGTSKKMSWAEGKSSSLVDCNKIRNSIADQDTQSRANGLPFFGSSNFITQLDILPSPMDRLRTNRSPSSTANSEAGYSRRCESVERGSDKIGPPETERLPREKRVTFVLENGNVVASTSSKKPTLTAEIRRQNFRVSRSKGNKSTTSSSIDSGFSNGNSSSNSTGSKPCDYVTRAAAPTVVGAETTAIMSAARNRTLPAPAEKRTASTSMDRPKQQQTIKRKLKSCRSRSFHKSLDSSMVAQQQNTRTSLISYKRPLKAVHPEVVTMISLVGLHSEEVSSQTDQKAVNVTADVEVSDQTGLEKKDDEGDKKFLPSVSARTKTMDESSLTGTIKFAGSSIEGVTFNQLNLDQKRNLFASSQDSEFSSVRSKEQQDVFSKTNTRRTKSLDCENVEPKCTSQDHSFLKCVPPSSTKEKECWSSFHKMSKKGLFVSFDTILRGLLTPTEYRLRNKDDLGFLATE